MQRGGVPDKPPGTVCVPGQFNRFDEYPKMTTILLKENEPFEVAIRRFRRAIEKNGLIAELRERQSYEKPTAVRKRKKAAAVKRLHKRLRSQQLPKKLH